MLYASYSEGFKSGGWTTRLSAPLSTAPDFEQETARSYELGWKSEFFDRRMLLNAAAFTTYITHGLANIAADVTFDVYNPPREWWLTLRIGS